MIVSYVSWKESLTDTPSALKPQYNGKVDLDPLDQPAEKTAFDLELERFALVAQYDPETGSFHDPFWSAIDRQVVTFCLDNPMK